MKEILYEWGGWNMLLFHWINDIPHTYWLDQVMLIGTQLGDHAHFVSYLCGMIVFVFLTMLQSSAPREVVASMGFATIAVFVFSFWIQGEIVGWLKETLDFPRPPLVLQDTGFFSLHPSALHVVGTPEYHHSLPSGHSVFAMLVAASFWPLLGRFRLLAVLFVIWVGVSRISLGMHFPADVVAGYLLSLSVVLAVRFFVTQAMLLQARGWKTASEVDSKHWKLV